MMLRRLWGLLSTRRGNISRRCVVINGGILVVETAVGVVVSAPIVALSVRCPLIFSHFIFVAMPILPDSSLFLSPFVGLQFEENYGFEKKWLRLQGLFLFQTIKM